MSDQSFNSIQNDEISLKEVIDFLIASWKAIATVGVLGLLSGVAYIFVTPSQYEAIAQIKMAQIDLGNSANPLGANLEDPNTLIARMKLPTAFSEKEVQACKLQKLRFPTEALANSIVKLTPVKGGASLVELKIRGKSREEALTCAQAIFEKIKDSQNANMNPYIEDAETLLIKHQGRLNAIQALVARSDKNQQNILALYFTSREELNFIHQEIIRLNRIISSRDIGQSKLTSSIYSSADPVFPKKIISMVFGLLTGLFLGLLYVFIRKAWSTYKLSLNG